MDVCWFVLLGMLIARLLLWLDRIGSFITLTGYTEISYDVQLVWRPTNPCMQKKQSSMDWESRKKELHAISSSKQLGMRSLDIMNKGMTQKESWTKPCGKTVGWVTLTAQKNTILQTYFIVIVNFGVVFGRIPGVNPQFSSLTPSKCGFSLFFLYCRGIATVVIFMLLWILQPPWEAKSMVPCFL